MVQDKKKTSAPKATTRRKVVTENAPSELPGGAIIPDHNAPIPQDDLVTVTVQKAFVLTLDTHQKVPYGSGIQEMPREHADHWWAVANGVQQYKAKK